MGSGRHAVRAFQRTAQVAAGGADRAKGAHQAEQRQGGLRHLAAGGGVRAGYWQVSPSQLADYMDAVHADRLDDDHLG